MAWLLLALFIGIGFLFAISSYFDAPSSPPPPPIPEDTDSESPSISGTTSHLLSDTSIAPDINPATGMVMMDGTGSVDAGGNPFGTISSDDMESIIDDSNSFDTFDSLDS